MIISQHLVLKLPFTTLAFLYQGAPNDITDMKEKFYDLERQSQRKSNDKASHEERIENIEKDVDHIMARGETSNVSGVPTMVSYITVPYWLQFYWQHIKQYLQMNKFIKIYMTL